MLGTQPVQRGPPVEVAMHTALEEHQVGDLLSIGAFGRADVKTN
jgi:hypothetical protein